MKKIVAFYPENRLREETDYFPFIERIIKVNGWTIVDYKQALTDKDIKVISLNFFENVTARSFFIAFMKFVKRLLLLLWFVVLQKKILFTVHNKIAHDTAHPIMSKMLIRLQLKAANNIIALCPETRNVVASYSNKKKILEKIIFIPHPMQEVVFNDKRKQNEKMRVLFAGQIRLYKNIELVIQLANDFSDKNVLFQIVGRVEDDDYKNKIITSVNGDNVKFEFGFIPKKHLYELIEESDVMVLPYNKSSSLNSGMMHVSMSIGTPCICPDIGSALSLHDRRTIYMYSYEKEDDHYESLKNTFRIALSDYESGLLAMKRLYCRKEMEKHNGFHLISEIYRCLLNEIYYD